MSINFLFFMVLLLSFLEGNNENKFILTSRLAVKVKFQINYSNRFLFCAKLFLNKFSAKFQSILCPEIKIILTKKKITFVHLYSKLCTFIQNCAPKKFILCTYIRVHLVFYLQLSYIFEKHKLKLSFSG